MTDFAGGTEPLERDQVQHAAAAPAPSGGAVRAGEPETGVTRDPVAAVKDPDNRAKLLLGIAAVTLLNLLLLLVILANVANDGAEPVNVQGKPCIIRNHEGQSTLFCAP